MSEVAKTSAATSFNEGKYLGATCKKTIDRGSYAAV